MRTMHPYLLQEIVRQREEFCGVWGGEVFLRGAIVPRKPPGRSRKKDSAA